MSQRKSKKLQSPKSPKIVDFADPTSSERYHEQEFRVEISRSRQGWRREAESPLSFKKGVASGDVDLQ
jgi:hypothetical protein